MILLVLFLINIVVIVGGVVGGVVFVVIVVVFVYYLVCCWNCCFVKDMDILIVGNLNLNIVSKEININLILNIYGG